MGETRNCQTRQPDEGTLSQSCRRIRLLQTAAKGGKSVSWEMLRLARVEGYPESGS